MDILIKNMGKPQYCYEEKDHYIIKPCPFLQTCYKEWRVYINAINVHSDACPLVEVKEAKIGVVYPAESKMWVEANYG